MWRSPGTFVALVALSAGILWAAAGFNAAERATLLWHVRHLWPPGPHLPATAARALAAWTLSVALLCMYNGLGLRLLPWLGVSSVPPQSAAAGLRRRSRMRTWRLAAPLVAYPLVSAALLGLACLGLWRTPVLAGVLAGLILTASFSLSGSLTIWREAGRGLWRDAGPVGRVALAAAAAWWILLETPPELDIDCLSYHLAFPQQLLTTHRLFGTDVYSHWAIPLVHEFPHAFPLLFGLDESARQLGMALSTLGVLAFLAAAVPALAPGPALAVAVTALSLPVARYVLATAKNDPVACGYFAAGAGLLLESGVLTRQVRCWPALAGAGWLLGTAFAMKYLMLPLVISLLAVSLFRCEHRRRGRVAGALAAAGAAPLVPWAAKSWCLLADPLYPIGSVALAGIFGNPNTREQTARLFQMYLGDVRLKSAVPREMLWLAARNACGLFAGAVALRSVGVPGMGALMAATGLGFFGMVFGIRGALDQVERFSLPAFVLWNAAGLGALLGIPRARRPAVLGVLFAGLSGLCQVRMVAAEWWPGGVWQHDKPASVYMAGRLDVEAYRQQGMFGYGRILPVLRGEIAGASRPRAVLAASEILLWGVPARLKTHVFEPPLLWRAAAESLTPERMDVVMRQANIGWIVHNAGIGAVARFDYSPYVWTPRMLALMERWASRHLTLLATGGMAVQGFGAAELFRVEPKPGAEQARLLFLPGTETALAWAALAQVHGAWADAISRYRALRLALPKVVWLDSLLADALLSAPADLSRTREAYALVRGADRAGLLDETSLLDLAITAGRLGHSAEAEDALRRAAVAYPLWPERVAAARRAAQGSLQ